MGKQHRRSKKQATTHTSEEAFSAHLSLYLTLLPRLEIVEDDKIFDLKADRETGFTRWGLRCFDSTCALLSTTKPDAWTKVAMQERSYVCKFWDFWRYETYTGARLPTVSATYGIQGLYIYMTALLGLYTEIGLSDPPPRRSAEDFDNWSNASILCLSASKWM